MGTAYPRCEIRRLLLHLPPVAGQADGLPTVVFYGRRGRPVKKPRFIPAPLAYELARRLHARRLCTISVI
jgi:hypothetical protein